MVREFDAEVRRRAVELYESGVSGPRVLEQLDLEFGVQPSQSSLTGWVAAHRLADTRCERQDLQHADFSAEFIGQVVASKVVKGMTKSQIAARFGCSTSSVGRWVSAFGPTLSADAPASFDEVVLATMNNVNEHRKQVRQQSAAAGSDPQASRLRPVDEWLPGEAPDLENLPDDPEELKRIIAAQVERDMVKNALLQAAFELRSGTDRLGTDRLGTDRLGTDRSGKDLACEGVPAAAVKAAAVCILAGEHNVSVRKACALVDLARSTFYDMRKQCKRARRRQEALDNLGKIITSVVEASGYTYGSRRVHKALKERGITVSEKIVRAVMGQLGLQPKQKRTKTFNSYQGENAHRPENLLLIDPNVDIEDIEHPVPVSQHFKTHARALGLHHDFHADLPYQKLGTDVTEIACADGKLYVSPIIDFHDGYIAALTTSTSPNSDLVCGALDQLLAQLPDDARPVLHSDRGFLYRTHRWIEAITDPAHDTAACPTCVAGETCIQRWRCVPSLSRKGKSGDNARVEGFFGTLKQERIYGRPEVAHMTCAEMTHYIETYADFYNNERLKSTLGTGYTTIAQHRQTLGA